MIATSKMGIKEKSQELSPKSYCDIVNPKSYPIDGLKNRYTTKQNEYSYGLAPDTLLITLFIIDIPPVTSNHHR